MRKNKKYFFSLFSILALGVNLIFPAFAEAYTIGLPSLTSGGSIDININEMLQEANFSSISQMASDALLDSTQSVEERYGFTENALKTAKRKVSAPRVDIFFDNTNPKAGEKVTAHSIGEFFKNDPQNLYYSWYIIHTKDGSIQSATNTIDSGVREASRIMARGDYDPELDGQDYANPKEDPDKDGWPAVDKNSYDEDKTVAPVGGADGVGAIPEETVDAFSSAKDWCDSKGNHTNNECSFNDGSSYRPLDTYFTPKSSQTNYYCDQCKEYFSGDGASAYASAKTTRNNCCYNATPQSSLQCSSTNDVTDPDTGIVTQQTTYSKCAQVDGTDYCGASYQSIFDSCYSNFESANKSTMSTCLQTEYNSCTTGWCNTHELALDSTGKNCDASQGGFSMYNEEATTQVSRCYKHNFGTSNNPSIFRENELSDSTTDDPSGLDIPVSCKHKWLNAPEYKSGSGKFPTGEEKYWKTDPVDPDTDGDGFPDEADVIGLGQESFTWTYQPGDRVGVAVEGTSLLPTDEKSSYYKIMWGYLGVCDSTKTGLMDNDQCDGSGDYGYGFFDTKAPGEETGKKLDVSLSFTPDTPIADPSDENKDNIDTDGNISDADQISVDSSLDSTNYNSQNLYYTWQISKSTDLASDNWEEVKDIKNNFQIGSATSGLGITSLNFVPKKNILTDNADIIYFKVTLTVSSASGVKTDRGRSSVIIPVNKNGLKISLYSVDLKDGKAALGKEICNEGLYQSLCPAVNGQMIAAKISSKKYSLAGNNFSWTLNGENYNPLPENTSLFDGWDGTTVFFPITKEEQEIEEISATVSPKDKLEPVIGTRLATVVKPTLFIRSSDTSLSWPTIMTITKQDAKYALEDIVSEDRFEAKPGSEVSYYLDFMPYYLIGDDYLNTAIDWEINGSSVFTGDYAENPLLASTKLENNDRTIKFPVDNIDGQSYTLGASVKKYWGEEETNFLASVWGIAPETLSGDTNISIVTKTPPEAADTTSMGKPKQILAAIGTNLPHYFAYLLRLVLTMLVMFFVSSVFYGVSQRIGFENDEK